MDETRRALDELILARKGCTYSGISRLLGRNVSYIQQYIRKGSPRYLDESDRNILARFFGVDERILGAPPHRSSPVVELVQIPVLDVEDVAAFPRADLVCSLWDLPMLLDVRLEREYERIPYEPLTQDVLGVPVRKVIIQVEAGRNIAVLVEAAVRNAILQLRGINTGVRTEITFREKARAQSGDALVGQSRINLIKLDFVFARNLRPPAVLDQITVSLQGCHKAFESRIGGGEAGQIGFNLSVFQRRAHAADGIK